MNDDVEELANKMVEAPPEVQIDFLLRSLCSMAEKLSSLLAERERLWVVVDAANELLDEDRTSWSAEHGRLLEALAALRGSAP